MKPLDPLDLTRRLVDIESLTYNEGAVGEFLDGFLRERGFTVERTAVPQPPNSHYSGPRFNLYAGTGKRPDVVLSTHMDTVPPFLPSREDDLYLYGRGTCDAKGIIAAQLAAAERLREAGRPMPQARRWPILSPRGAVSSSTASPPKTGWRWLRKVLCARKSAPRGRWRIPRIRNWGTVLSTNWCMLWNGCWRSSCPRSRASAPAR